VSCWLGVVSADHVHRGVSLGIAQIGHGKRAGLARMSRHDILVYYSPVQRQGDKTPLRCFTALGAITDDETWQADEDDFRPFRRRVRYEATRPVSVDDVKALLALTSTPNWGYQLRRGLIPLMRSSRSRSAIGTVQALGRLARVVPENIDRSAAAWGTLTS